MSIPAQSLPWPEGAPVVPIAAARPAIDRLASLAARHGAEVELIPGLAQADGAIAADPPPCLEQITDEFGGALRHGMLDLDLLIAERSENGPYTLMGPFTTFYPVHEEQDMAVVLTIGDDGSAGALYGVGDDLALQLAATDLVGWIGRYAEALETSVGGLDAGMREMYGEDVDLGNEETRTDVLGQLMDRHLYTGVLGMADPAGAHEIALQDPAAAGIAGLPEGTVAVADFRGAPLGARADVLEADLPGDPLDYALAWREGGLVVCIVRR